MKMINENHEGKEMYNSYWKERKLGEKVNVKGKNE